MYMNNKST